ncbi:MAG TPA: endopeptidase La [bacterium]|nr:endopeptidase La [bacterium]
MAKEPKPFTLPILALKMGVIYPGAMVPVTVGRPSSVKAVDAALGTKEKEIVILGQKSPVDEPGLEDLRRIGTRAVIKRAARPDDEIMEVLLMGKERVELVELQAKGPYLQGSFKPLPLPPDEGPEAEALRREIVDLGMQVVAHSEPLSAGEVAQVLSNTRDPGALLYLLATLAHPESAKAQEILECPALLDAMKMVQALLTKELQVLKVRRDIAEQAQSEISKEQREYILRENLRAIREELGEKSPEEAEAVQLRKRFEKVDLPENVRKEAERELDRLTQTPQASPEFGVIRTYLDYLLELPWNTLTEETLDIAHARQVLDEDHYGLRDLKDRILEHLGVMKLNPGAKSPILCFVGPPGVGKTSVGQSIARAIGRKFERMSLGGLHDEAELRGHRRTYIGALPGRILQALRRAGSRNPLLMLDEVDKLGQDFRGDPASALLEILDPEQNFSFRDNYLDLPFDLSKVFFITTANTVDSIPRPLLDRMEVLRLPGYSNLEKKEIAVKYLLPRQLRQTGLTLEKCSLGPGTLETLIARYTREAGVRQLERSIAGLFRKAALQFAEKPDHAPITVAVEDLSEYLGPAPFFEESLRKELTPGVAAGLAWTEAGGEVLYVECALLPDSRGLTLTGQLGEVMQESAKAAQTYIWSHADRFGIRRESFRRSGVHLHVPSGAVPKDGPSAGVTMAAALASLYTGLTARGDTAMTGEITLSGLVLPIGGVKEKVLAAHRSQIKRIVLPRENEKDLKDVPEHVRNALEFVFADRIEDALTAVIPGLAERLQPAHS